jgi:hypothetical protein
MVTEYSYEGDSREAVDDHFGNIVNHS